MYRSHTIVAQELRTGTKTTPRKIRVVPVQVYGTSVPALWGTDAVPNLLSSRLARDLALSRESTDRIIKVSDGSPSPPRRVVKGVPLSFAAKTASLEFLAGDDMAVDVIIGSPTMESLEAKMDMGHS